MEDFLGRNFLGRFFWEEYFKRNYLVEINKELMFLSRFWSTFVSMHRILILRSATQAHRIALKKKIILPESNQNIDPSPACPSQSCFVNH